MPYQFSLEFLLRLYSAMEQREEMKLSTLLHELSRIQQQIETCITSRRQLRESLGSDMATGVNSVELHFQEITVDLLRQRQRALEIESVEANRKCEAQRELLIAARRRRELLQALRDKELQEHQREVARREQNAIDELFLMRRNLHRN